MATAEEIFLRILPEPKKTTRAYMNLLAEFSSLVWFSGSNGKIDAIFIQFSRFPDLVDYVIIPCQHLMRPRLHLVRHLPKTPGKCLPEHALACTLQTPGKCLAYLTPGKCMASAYLRHLASASLACTCQLLANIRQVPKLPGTCLVLASACQGGTCLHFLASAKI